MNKVGAVPLTEVANRTDGQIRLLDFDVPGIDPGNLQINTDRTLAVMRWGGIANLSLGSYEGGQTTYTPARVKLNLDGTLSATKAKVEQKAAASARSQENNREKIPDFQWRSTASYVNQEEPPAHKKQNIALDRILRKELIRDIWKNEADLGRLSLELILGGWYIFLSGGIKNGMLVKALFGAPVSLGIQRMMRSLERDEIPPQKLSTQLYWYGDRALIATAHLARPLITPIKT